VKTDGRTGGQTDRRSVFGAVWAYRLCVVLFALVPILPCYVQAQARPPVRPSARPPELTVYLMTMGPGERVWERFGHNAIWIHDPVRGTDQTYNYGLFDFGQEGFLLRFVQGRMWYWMQGFPAQSYVESYRRDNRSVWVQELEMTPEAKRELQAFLEWNERPENRFYHYDYYRDNCSTRVRDALDRALGGLIRESSSNVPTGRSFRSHTLRLTSNDPPVYTGLELGLGQPVDQPISMWEEMFLPLALRVHLRKISVDGPDGRPLPLVKSERTLYQSTEPAPPAVPPFWVPFYVLAGGLIGGLALGLGAAAAVNRTARAGFLVTTWSWWLLSGVAGLVVAGLWCCTDHSAAYRNANVLQTNLLALPLLWFGTRLVFGSERAATPAIVLAGLLASASLLGLLLQTLPAFRQVNGDIIALALPAHAGVAGAVWRLARQGSRTRRAASRASG
jgi:Domain of unknown function (DUF4105)